MPTVKTSAFIFLSTFFYSYFAHAEQLIQKHSEEEGKHYIYQYKLAPATAKKVKHTVRKSNKSTKHAYLKKLARQVAVKYKLPPKLFLALVTQESQWRTKVISKRGATGLTQLMPKTAKAICKLNRWELTDAKKNLDCGAKYLSQQIKRFGVIRKGVCAFNAGPTIVAKLGRCPRYKETQHYVNKLMMTLN